MTASSSATFYREAALGFSGRASRFALITGRLHIRPPVRIASIEQLTGSTAASQSPVSGRTMFPSEMTDLAETGGLAICEARAVSDG